MENVQILIYNAHSGKQYRANPYAFASISELKHWIYHHLEIPLASSLLLTAQGARLREASFHETKEIYVFDKDGGVSASNGTSAAIIANNNPGLAANDRTTNIKNSNSTSSPYADADGTEYEPDINNEIIKPVQSPLADFSVQPNPGYKAMSNILTTNASWSAAVVSDAIVSEERIHEKIDEISAMFKSLNIVSKYLDMSYQSLNHKFEMSCDVVKDLNRNSLCDSWEVHYIKLENIPLLNDSKANLTSLLSYESLESFVKNSLDIYKEVGTKSAAVEKSLTSIEESKSEMENKIQLFKKNSIIKNFSSSNLDEMVQQVKSCTQTIQSETREELAHFPDSFALNSNAHPHISEQDITRLTNTIKRHQQKYVPQLLRSANDLYYLQVNLDALYKKLASTISEVMIRVNNILSSLAEVKTTVKEFVGLINSLQAAESKVFTVLDLPLLYGLFLLENVRRIEWENELKSIFGKTVENFAIINEKELKYRKKWEKNYSTILKLLHLENIFTLHNLVSVDLTINKDKTIKELTLDVQRKDVEKYIVTLHSANISRDSINVLQAALRDLDNQKVNLYSKFESYLNFVVKKDSNTSDNELIKSYQTRIKKLESLLHQSKFKKVNQWPMTESSRSKSPAQRTDNHKPLAPSPKISPKLNITAHRSLSTTSLNKVSTLITSEKKPEKVEKKRTSFGRMFGVRPRKESLLLNNGNIELTNSVLFIENPLESNKMVLNDDPTSPARRYSLNDASNLDTDYIKVPVNEWTQLKNQTNELSVENQELKEQNSQLIEEIKTVVKEFEARKGDLRKLGDQEVLIEKLNSENSDLNEELEKVSQKAQSLETQMVSKDRELFKAQKQNQELQRQLGQQLEKFKIAAEKRKTEENQAESLVEQVLQKDAEITQKEAEIKKKLLEIEKQNDKIGEKQLEVDEAKKTTVQLENVISEHKAQIVSLKADVEFQRSEVQRVQQSYNDEEEITKYQNMLMKKNKEYAELSEKIQHLETELADTSAMKKDLLANMQSREALFASERNDTQEEMNQLRAKIEALEYNEDALDTLNKELAEKNSSSMNMIAQLLDINQNFRQKLYELTVFLFNDFKLVCSCFEQVGLILIKGDNVINEDNGFHLEQTHDFLKLPYNEKGIRVLRVKGLRSKNKVKDDSDLSLFPSSPISPLVADAEKTIGWIKSTTEEPEKHMSSSVVSSSIDIQKIESDARETIERYNSNAEFEKEYFGFVSNSTLEYNLIYQSISKRFGDIEHLAKKLQKESKTTKEELVRLSNESRTKIAVTNFKVGDLILFLPTRDGDNNLGNSDLTSEFEKDKIQPWAAFNLGSPHYFLKNSGGDLSNRDWMVSRVLKIEEFKVNSANVEDEGENPFHLSVGITWYLIEAEDSLAEA